MAANVAGLGAVPYLVGVVGTDSEAKELSRCLEKMDVSDEFLISNDSRATGVKTRVVANNQQIVRVDRENAEDLGRELESTVLEQTDGLIDRADIVLISDYAKGVVTKKLAKEVINKARKQNKKVLVDPKGKDYDRYRSASILTPNQKETLIAGGFETDTDNSVMAAGGELVLSLGLEHLVVTRGEKGMSLFSKDSEPRRLETVARRVYDVTGAGDTVISTIAVALGANAQFYEACELANRAAGKVIEHVGTTPVSCKDLLDE